MKANSGSVIRGIFINNRKAQDSIYESGLMVFNCLKLSNQYTLDYLEIDIDQRKVPLGYDFYFFNYHPSTMSWLDTSKLKKLPGLVLTMVLEVLPNDPFVLCPDNHFHGYCVIDPTMKLKNKRVFPFPRPLEKISNIPPYVEKEVPVIGSFGFATRGKGFQHVVDAVNREFENAVVRINIPFGDFVPDSEKYAQYLAGLCRERAKRGIDVLVTHEYMSKEQLINWCAKNTLNCFLYDRNMPGLAATTDQAIVAGRPLAVSQNETFRHILQYLPPYPQWSLKESIERSPELINKMLAEWSPENFAKRFSEVLNQLLPGKVPVDLHLAHFEIPVLKNNVKNKIIKKYRKYKRLFSKARLQKILRPRYTRQNEELI
jgi:hypothetical protein